MKKFIQILSNPYVLLVSGTFFLILGSAKWTLFFGPWIGFLILLKYSRENKGLKSIFLLVLALLINTLIGGFEVMPAPLPIFIIVSFIISLKMLLPFLVDKSFKAADRGFLGSLVFPAVFVSIEYLDSFGGGGTWGSIANTQYQFQALQQLAAITGIWGISFLVYWFAPVVLYVEKEWTGLRASNYKFISIICIYILALTYGWVRIGINSNEDKEHVQIAGITLNNTKMMEVLYQEEFGEPIHLHDGLSQTSPEVQKAYSALPPFIENPTSNKFSGTRNAMDENLDELFRLSAVEAKKDAKIIVWSEAIGLVLKDNEEDLIERGQSFAKENEVMLVMGLGVINPGPMDGNHLYMVNKTITVSEEGEVLNEYLKSNPVPFAEPDYGSDDIIPVLITKYGNISPVICYDADFNHFMKQAGQIDTDILLVPSGDWRAIAPYHSYMAALRGIENGCSVIRPVNRGTLLATDSYGNVLAENYFFDEDGKILRAQVPVKGVNTIYNQIGDLFAYLCLSYTAISILFMLVLFIKNRFFVQNLSKQTI